MREATETQAVYEDVRRHPGSSAAEVAARLRWRGELAALVLATLLRAKRVRIDNLTAPEAEPTRFSVRLVRR